MGGSLGSAARRVDGVLKSRRGSSQHRWMPVVAYMTVMGTRPDESALKTPRGSLLSGRKQPKSQRAIGKNSAYTVFPGLHYPPFLHTSCVDTYHPYSFAFKGHIPKDSYTETSKRSQQCLELGSTILRPTRSRVSGTASTPSRPAPVPTRPAIDVMRKRYVCGDRSD